MKHLLPLAFVIGTTLANDTSLPPAIPGPEPLGAIKGEESVIRMVSEKIDITFGKHQSKVHCRFVFRSTKPDAPAKQIVGFPASAVSDDYVDVSSITQMTTRVDGKEVVTQKETGWFQSKGSAPSGGLGDVPQGEPAPKPVTYHTMEVTFPPDRDVIIERDYIADNGSSVLGDHTFDYTTLSGAIWQGSIGRAEFTLNLDGLTVDDLAFEDGPQKRDPRWQMTFCSPNKECWKVESPTKLTMVWENFEPAVHKTRQGIFLTTWRNPKEH
ncbi:hypothetical protein [Luteolibacter sp. LG18]|uniref:hypothetical protein n=1 Tax=Luteolibacter sp. LG18 TaxID=2819286 RepID=UPI002B2D6259|nr:hypothetical protein llg_18720 [Luteolibacter sp. LG18]